MALKYFFEYNNVNNVLFRCEIDSAQFDGDDVEVSGRCLLNYADVDGHFEPIRGLGMTMQLDASIDLPFDDLATENEREYRATLYMAGNVIFVGFIEPEGIYEDWVSDRWTMDISVNDGLGYLENLSYVDDAGLPFTGFQTHLEIIKNCLNRTGIALDINTKLDIEYVGQVAVEDVLDNAKALTQRYFREDEDTIMDCKEVLTSILNIYNACICQQSGQWWVFKASEIKRPNLGGILFFSYDSDGVVKSPATRNLVINRTIGSHINNADIFHCNENQRKEKRSSLSSFRVNYKYGLLDRIYVNEDMRIIGQIHSTGSLEGWIYITNAKVVYTQFDSVNYVTLLAFRGQDDLFAGDDPLDVIKTNDIDIIENVSLVFDMSFITERFINSILCRINLTVGTTVYYLDLENGWVESASGDETIFLTGPRNSEDSFEDYKITTPPAIGDGVLTFTFLQPRTYWPISPKTRKVWIKSFKVFPSVDNSINGVFHTITRRDTKSNRVDDVLEVYNGDNPENIYEGSIYQSDGETRTQLWRIRGTIAQKPLLRLLAEERINLLALVQTLFSGDIYGYINYLSKVTISGIPGIFLCISHSYDTYSNITSLALLQIYNETINNVDYEFEIDYGNTVKPTIKG